MDRPESWKPAPGFDGFYELSDLGRVRSLDRYVRHSSGGMALKRGRILTPHLNSDRAGHLQVRLCRDGAVETHQVHRLVLEAFVGPCPPGQECLHGPGGPTDNRWPENIRWGTKSENELDKWRDGTMLARLTPEIVIICSARHAAGDSFALLAREYGVRKSTMHAAVTGKTWKTNPALSRAKERVQDNG